MCSEDSDLDGWPDEQVSCMKEGVEVNKHKLYIDYILSYVLFDCRLFATKITALCCQTAVKKIWMEMSKEMRVIQMTITME